MENSLVVSPTPDPRRVRAADGTLLSVPAGWALLPPGDAGLTRRVKAAGPTWTVQEKKGRKTFSRGVWAPAEHITTARDALVAERSTPAYARRRETDLRRREKEQAEYEVEFGEAVRTFLRFSKTFATEERLLTEAVTSHATPVGSGTVARTERIPVERRAEAAVIAWLRHQTTAYDHMRIARVKGERRQVRRELAEISRALLDLHRRDVPHARVACTLCSAVSRITAAATAAEEQKRSAVR